MHKGLSQSLDELAFAKQFLIAPATFETDQLKGWNVALLNAGSRLYSHPALDVTWASTPETSLCGLGMFLDPWLPDANDHAILWNLARDCARFHDLESRLSRLSGRWLLVATIGEHTRVYPDATGQKPIFRHVNEGVFGASQPALFHHLGLIALDADLKKRFEADNHSGSWPINITPYREVEQVLPNHYLTLPEGKIVRFWPRQPFEEKTMEDAAREMLFILRGTILAATRRRSCVMSLSGGYDSRINLAAASPAWNQTRFVSFKHRYTAHHDRSIPRRLRHEFSLHHKFVRISRKTSTDRIPARVLDRLHRNVGGMYYNRPARAANALAQFADQSLHLPGTIAKVNRCFYYPDGHHPADISETELAKRAGFAGNSLAEAGFFIWLYALPPNLPVQLLDLLYWEHHAGVWSACGLSFGEGLVDSVPPMNCRRFLEVGLSTRVEDRKAPYALVRRIIGLAQPGLLEYRFNQDWVDDWHRFRSEKIPLPWSVKQTLGWTR